LYLIYYFKLSENVVSNLNDYFKKPNATNYVKY